MANIEFSNYVESLDPASITTGTILIPVSHDGDPESMTPAQIVTAGGGGGGGSVVSVVPTTNRISVDDTDPANPVIDIDTAYDAAVQAVADAKVADAINNGTTAIAPSQNAVFDALALKTDQLTSFRRLTASHTLDATDLAAINAGDDLVIEMNVASANDLTVPANATQAFPVGTKITGIQYGAGQTSIVASGGVTIHTSSGDFLARAQYAPFLLEKVATDEWYLSNGSAQAVIVSSGTWTPTLTNTTNIAASTAYACQYLRVGNTVSFSGKFSLDSTSTGDTVMGMSIPIASAFSQEFHAGGVAASYAVQQSAAIFADATNDRLTIRLTITDTTNRDWFFSGSYQII